MQDYLEEFLSLVSRWGKYTLARIDRWANRHPGLAGFITGVLLAASMFNW